MSECTKQSFGEASSRSIQRYDAVRNEHDVEHSETGEYVKYEVVENLQARIAELEVTNSMLHDMISGMKRTTNEIQAQGIKEMLCDNNYEESTGWIEEYANKLRAKQ